MEKQSGGPRFLRWPWNVVIYILLAVVLRLFSIPFILGLMWYQQKHNPHGAAEGYCLSHTRKRISWVFWSLLLLVIAAALFSVFFVGLGQDRAYWDTMDYVTLVVSGGGSIALFLLGIYMGCTALRDTFFPAKSGLANSIRSQLPYPEEAPPVEELFAMVDNDLKAHGQWFEAVGIGQEWVLGDLATRIDRIRGIFVVDKIHQHTTKTGVRTNRTLELVLIDNRWQRHATSFNNPSELQAAAECLHLRVPDAALGRNDQSTSFWTMDESAREEFEWEFRQKQNRRASAQAQREAASGGSQDMILKTSNGEITSRVTLSLVEDTLRQCLADQDGIFSLTPTLPIAAEGRQLRALHVSVSDETIWLLAELADNPGYGPARAVDERQAKAVLEGWLGRQAPDLTGWELRRLYTAPQSPRPRQQRTQDRFLQLVLASGAAESHTTFTREDVRVAAEGIVDGSYQLAALNLPGGMWIRVEAGDKSDARCTVRATRPDPDKLRFFETKTTPRQAASWLTGYFEKSFLPGGEGWKDYTRQVEKNIK